MSENRLIILTAIIGLSVAACVETSEPQQAVVRKIECTTSRCETTVQFEDGTVFSRSGRWMEEGDTIVACKETEGFINKWTNCGANLERDN